MTINILIDWLANFIDSTFSMNPIEGRIDALISPIDAPAKAVSAETLGSRMATIPGKIATVMYMTILMIS